MKDSLLFEYVFGGDNNFEDSIDQILEIEHTLFR
jgi:hypothetical protein